jgi:copper(I)-binding protein
MNKSLLSLGLAAALATSLVSLPAQAQTTVTDPWIRGTVAQQKATGLFTRITSAQGGRLVAARSPVAGVVEIHEMRMDGQIMRMRALPAGLELPPGQAVELRPGGYHVMLMELKQPMNPGDSVPVSLVIEGRDGRQETLELKVPVRPLTAMNPPRQAMPAGEHKH